MKIRERIIKLIPKRTRLRIYLKLHSSFYRRISVLVTELNGGIHPKHELMGYYRFFKKNLEKDSVILDVGCGIGYLSHKLAPSVKEITAIDNNPISIIKAKEFHDKNINFIIGDVMNYEFDQKYDSIVLSNVLEHFKDRKALLEKLKSLSNRILIRVPMFDRSWLVLYKKFANQEYRLDNDHKIEYTLESFTKEMEDVGLRIISTEIKFGELWAVVIKD